MKRVLSAGLLAVISLTGAVAQSPAGSIFDYLVEQGVSEVTIVTDLTALTVTEARAEEGGQAAVLTFVNATGAEETWNLELSLRGKFRRRVCDFPPLKLNFSKSDLRARGWADYDKYKLVTHCQDDRAAGREALMREFAAYRMYNVLTPNSYRVHPLRVRYEDSTGAVSGFRQHAFILESTKQLADRLAGKECEDCLAYANEAIDAEAANLHAVFQYMIGNADFNLSMLRNVKLFTRKGGTALPVGYDFDFAAVVNAPYAIPARELGQSTIFDRVFLGARVSDAQMEATLAHFEAKRVELFDVIKDQSFLSATARAEMRTYLKSFYAHLSDLRADGPTRTYSQMRDKASEIVPPGAKPEDFGVRK